MRLSILYEEGKDCKIEANGVTDELIFGLAVAVSNLLVNLKGDFEEKREYFELALSLNLIDDLLNK